MSLVEEEEENEMRPAKKGRTGNKAAAKGSHKKKGKGRGRGRSKRVTMTDEDEEDNSEEEDDGEEDSGDYDDDGGDVQEVQPMNYDSPENRAMRALKVHPHMRYTERPLCFCL